MMMMMNIMLDLGILTSGTTPNLDMPPPYSLVIMVVWGLLRLIGTTTATNMQDKHTMDNSHTKIIIGSHLYFKSMLPIKLGLSTVQCGNPNQRVDIITSCLVVRHSDDHG